MDEASAQASIATEEAKGELLKSQPPPSGPSRNDGHSKAPLMDTPGASVNNSLGPLSPLDAWANFNLDGRRTTLDQQSLEIADRQEASASARKHLATVTRSFKKSLAEGVVPGNKSTMALVKEYQTEIDSLTARAKASEIAFLNLYKALIEAPDPVEDLKAAAADRATLAELRVEINDLRNDRTSLADRASASKKHEARIAELEKELQKTGEQAVEDARVQMEAKQAQWMSAQHKTIEAYELREQELLHQISVSGESSRRLKSNADNAQQQLNEARSQLQELRKSRDMEHEMVLEDLEKARAEINALRKRCGDLEAGTAAEKVVDFEASDGFGGGIGRSELSAELAARDVEVSQLKDQINALEGVLGGKDSEKSNEFAQLTSTIAEKTQEVSRLKDELSKLPSVAEYETMKRQYDALRAFQLNEDDLANESDANGDDESGEPSVSSVTSDSLEKRLLRKVRLLEGKLTRLRVELGDRDSRIQNLVDSSKSLEEQVGDQKLLISRLEDGINAMTGDPTSVHALKTRAAVSSRALTSPAAGNEPPELKSNATQDNGMSSDGTWDWGDHQQAAGLQNIIKEEPTMLDIVSGQRNRFRTRAMELEDDNRKLVERIEKLTSDLDALKGDNVRLYEKIRFVQSYRRGGEGSSDAKISALESGTLAMEEEDTSGGFLGKYRVMYEDMVNPYTLFNRRERYKRLSEMSAPERLTLRAGQRALSTRTSRLIVFFYVLALHVLVFLVLGFSSHSCDGDLTTKAQHVNK